MAGTGNAVVADRSVVTGRAVVAGHICLDVIPRLDHLAEGAFSGLFQPGHLITTGPAIFSTGGPVSNTGLALFRLGIPTRLVAKVGADPFGGIIRELVDRYDPALTGGLVTDPNVPTSYSVVISPPGQDRIFFHCQGANDDFGAADVDMQLVSSADLFHFGYPPIMRRMYADGGAELAQIFQSVKAAGVTTSLDMAFPDPTSPSGKANWHAILSQALPFVDVFLPSIEEILFMLRRDQYDRLVQGAGGLLGQLTPDLLSDLANELIGMGCKMVVLKLGHRGLYLRTAPQAALQGIGRAAPCHPAAWANQELWSPCFRVNVVGTTGSGDATIAGFFSALLRGLDPGPAVTAAVAVGACNVEAADALSGIRPWEATLGRIQSGWERLPLKLDCPGWRCDLESGLWIGPARL